MAIYDIYGSTLSALRDINGTGISAAYDINGFAVWRNEDGINRTLKNARSFPDPLGFRVGEEYVETFIAEDGYTLEGATVSVVMDGEDITESVYTMGAVVIDSVSEDLSISIEAVKINYVTPPASDFTLQLYNGKQAIKAYNGDETAIEIPAEISVDGTRYETCMYSTTMPTTVEHLKLSCAIPAYSTLQQMCSSLKIDNLKTYWNNTGTDLYTATGVNAERILTPNQKDATAFKKQNNNARLSTARQMEYPTAVTTGDTLYYGDSALVDAGTIPSWWTSLYFAFFTCSSLRRISIDAKGITAHGNWISGVPADCKVKIHPDSETFKYMRSQAVGGSGSGYAQPVLRLYPYDDSEEIHTILCIGDSLTRGVGCDDAATEAYPAKLLEKLSNNTIVYNEGLGSTTTEWHRDKMLNNANMPYLNDALVILWTGTNGNGSDSTVETLETLIEEMISAMGNNTKFLLIPAVAAALGASGTEAYASHKQWCIDRYGADHMFDVYEWFSSLGYTRSDYMTDTLHYNADGYAIIADGIYEKLNANGWVTPA